MVIWNELEDAPPPRERTPRLRRGQDAAHLRQVETLGDLGALGEVPRGHVPDPAREDEHASAMKPMNCPGHMLLFGSALRSYRELPLRYAEAAPLHRNELTGTLHGLTARPARDAGRRAHLLHARADRRRDLRRARLRCAISTASSGSSPAPSSRRVPTTSSAPTRSGTSPRARSRAALERHEHRVLRQRGRGRVLRAEDRPAHDRRPRPLLADGHDPARLADAVRASGSRTWARTTPSTRRTSSIAPSSARSSASSGS